MNLSNEEIIDDAASLVKDLLISLAQQEMPLEDHLNALEDLSKILSASKVIISTYADSLAAAGTPTIH